MKNLITFALLVISSLPSLAQYTVTPQLGELDYGSTNSFVVDASGASAFALQCSFWGEGARTATSLLALTNKPATGATFGINHGGTWSVYTWVPTVQTTVTNYSGYGTNLNVAMTNGTVNGNTVSVVLNGNTNIFTFTNAPAATTDVLTNTTAAGSATNLLYAFGGIYNEASVSGVVVTLKSGVGGAIYALTSSVSTNTTDAYATVATIVATNTYQVATNVTKEGSATNMFNAVQSNTTNRLICTMLDSNVLSFVTVGNPGWTLTNSAGWMTNTITTNAIAGSVKFLASNSVDRVTWIYDSAKNFNVAYSTTTPVSTMSNWTSLGAIGYWKFSAENSATNYAIPQGLQIKSAVKPGF